VNAETSAARNGGHLLTALDFPPPQLIAFGRQNRFRGMVLDSGGRIARAVRVRLDEEPPREFPANRPSEDLAAHLPQLPAARNCRFDFQIPIGESSRLLTWEAVWEEGGVELLFEYDLAEVRGFSAALRRMQQGLEVLEPPPSEIVLRTQGHGDVDAYRNSIIPGIWNMRRYLAACGIETDAIHSILDFGCGSGRLLTGWLLLGGDRVLVGCDSSAALTDWARAHLPDGARVDRSSHLPPLPYGDGEFDFAYAISVVTHLRYRTQEAWAQELARILRPGGILLVTAHGPLYVDLFAAGRRAEFSEAGHLELEGAEDGSNEFASFHAPDRLTALFDRFEPVGYFPEGRVRSRRTLFPLAGMQDVYVFRRR
jgi:SAM-dependent methyltransferase